MTFFVAGVGCAWREKELGGIEKYLESSLGFLGLVGAVLCFSGPLFSRLGFGLLFCDRILVGSSSSSIAATTERCCCGRYHHVSDAISVAFLSE